MGFRDWYTRVTALDVGVDVGSATLDHAPSRPLRITGVNLIEWASRSPVGMADVASAQIRYILAANRTG